MTALSFNLNASSIYIIIMLQMNWSQPYGFDAFFYTYYDLSTVIQWQKQYFQFVLPGNQNQSQTCPKPTQNISDSSSSSKSSKKNQECKQASEEQRSPPRKIKILKKRERQDNFLKKKQKKNRNLPSNILKIFILNLYSHPNLQQSLLDKGVKTQNFNLEILVQKMKNIITTTQNYIRPSTVQQIYSEGLLGEEEGKAFRMLFKKFLLFELPMIITPMRKYRRREKRQILSFGRKILNNLNQRQYL